MCGIVGYISKNKGSNGLKLGLEALKRLEYRGYDSSGFVAWDEEKKNLVSKKAVGKIVNLENEIGNEYLMSNCCVLHTRWATHGEPNTANCHPHSDCKENIWLVHNGIIENHKTLKAYLEKEGHVFKSNTDTEVLSHLVEKYYNGNLENAVRQALKFVKGSYGIAVIAKDDPNKIVATKLSSPLILGVGTKEFIIASDPCAVIAHTKKVVYLKDKEMAIVTPDGFKIMDSNGDGKNVEIKELDWSFEEAQKGNYSHFMIKEIFEGPDAIRNSFRGRLVPQEGLVKFGVLEVVDDKLRQLNRLIIVGCGTARYACLVGEYMFEEYAGIPTEVDSASEFRYRQKPTIDKNTAILAISQSGETADTLAAIKEAKIKGAMALGITNVVGSTQSREIDAGVYNHIGPEIAVASTKAFISQLTIEALLSVYFGRERGMSFVMGKRIIDEIQKLPKLAQKVLEQEKQIKRIAKKYSKYRNFFFLGRKYNYPVALEGALKLKEVVPCIHAEGYAAGEMKHGPIALIDENFPSVCICPSDSVYDKMVTAISELKARKGKVIAIATEGNEEIAKIADDVIYIPKTLEMLTPILAVIPLQLMAAYMGIELGFDIDKPRNLAKSVTVE